MGTTSLSRTRRPGRWPRKLRLAFEAIVTVFMSSYQAARSRAAGSPSKTVRLLAELDDATWRIGLLERELAIQRRLDAFSGWYNERPHQGLGGLTPNQAWNGVKRLKTKAIRSHEPQPEFTVTRRRFRGDSHLAVLDVSVDWPEAA